MHNFIPPHRFFPYLTWTEIAEMPDRENTVIIQPIGAIEQHGPHLPLIVDAAIATAVTGKALEKLDRTIPAYALSTLYYGKSNEHWHFPGTITLTSETLMSVLMEVGESIYRAGFRKLVFVNAHGGQPQILEMVARDLHQQHEDFMVFPLFVWRVPHIAKELFSPEELELGIHAGDIETSVMLSILPDVVRREKVVREFPHGLPSDSLLSMEGKLPFAWVTRDLSASGVLGDATAATEDKGTRLLESVVDSWVKAIADIYKFQQPQCFRSVSK
ncbi:MULTISPECIES: creatininase family protein [Oscillatoriales]|jgi:creatinine amidohydrolase|uniref:Creatininase n=1 Tax=Limnospira platensis NIES-46 TaxID=1236695 RepID=A0A5M3T2U4_LIMPL|nr:MULTISPECIES: creatininase family protein [Arthrospira]AMW29535.1 creatinine amidohydrolase [Arthrospira platensis YZ]KDR56946.1 creatinine amidohydrolase [Arthrospira platensis str. Paraca]MBD2669030.1 creatininase family protein [Arthrospira platensis FACHB-439]MBD2709561.1 creatininase family protein [Arthrospira platensis FACHB-835]MDF2212523.1 creatininase family protein [Arthrospira platensis NCB002]MDT9181515.1 creatininase family protein [Limnospira sp. PMC 289.06]MDT9294057.1 cre